VLVIALTSFRLIRRKGPFSAASSAIKAGYWSLFIVTMLYILFFATLGFQSINHLPIFNLLPSFSNQISTFTFAITAIIIAISFFIEYIMEHKLFAFEPKTITVKSKLPNGTIGVAFKDNPKHPDYVASAHKTETEEHED
jgi:hypothetical protein